MSFARAIAVGSLVALGVGCKVGGCAAHALGDIVGETGDTFCDRRFVAAGKERASFCQEVIDTVATGQVADDCRDKFGAVAGDGRCPREKIIAGCKLHKDNDDGSEVWDWYYDVSGTGDAGEFGDAPRTKDDVRALCADPKRYEEGATFDDAP
jgi:hypothetical protein